ncbi:unnamed protein product [Trichogramma brassicae]|uniref:Reverse transcriptase domain-containing protein n=1 Tax=Trichogramma brassicae TaxID=86971 RepID=A0A6H5IBB3_9HYME|nr:unnamed protein product [Trichogramma brassicae]
MLQGVVGIKITLLLLLMLLTIIVLDPHQFGFRPEHSTQTAILDLTETIRHAIDKHKVSLVVSFDFSKAFDSIPHTLIIKKLRLIGCTASALDWFASYLSGRSQAICLSDGSCSSFMTTTAGVPQGSVLGPLLFLVFINDLSARLSSSQHMIYADDTQIFCSDLPARAHILLDRSDISAIVAWAEDNGISLNSDKTGAMLCGSQFYVNALKESTPPLFVGDAQLQMMPELTILGLKLTPIPNIVLLRRRHGEVDYHLTQLLTGHGFFKHHSKSSPQRKKLSKIHEDIQKAGPDSSMLVGLCQAIIAFIMIYIYDYVALNFEKVYIIFKCHTYWQCKKGKSMECAARAITNPEGEAAKAVIVKGKIVFE